MSYEQYLQDGQLSAALSTVEGQIRKQPADAKHRIFLFQLLLVQGKWERAAKQLDVIKKLDASAIAMVQMYHAAISCELFRESVFKATHDPMFLGQPEEWQALLLQAFKLDAQEKFQEAASVRAKAFELAPASPGTLDGHSFDWIADADMRLGPMLEMIVEGKYFWVAFEHIELLELEAPSDLRDLVWLPGHVRWRNGGEAYVLIPSRYPGSEREDDLALARRTEWEEPVAGTFHGFGQRILATDAEDFSLLDVRKINLGLNEVEGDKIEG
ncbi:MAG: type VI secretion system accessory protein TagJ [Thiolinea sp.]